MAVQRGGRRAGNGSGALGVADVCTRGNVVAGLNTQTTVSATARGGRDIKGSPAWLGMQCEYTHAKLYGSSSSVKAPASLRETLTSKANNVHRPLKPLNHSVGKGKENRGRGRRGEERRRQYSSKYYSKCQPLPRGYRDSQPPT